LTLESQQQIFRRSTCGYTESEKAWSENEGPQKQDRKNGWQAAKAISNATV